MLIPFIVFLNPPGLSGRIVFCTLLIASMISFAYYTSAFTSFLTYREVKMPFTNLEEMVTNKEYQILIPKDSIQYQMFRVSHQAEVTQKTIKTNLLSFSLLIRKVKLAFTNKFGERLWTEATKVWRVVTMLVFGSR